MYNANPSKTDLPLSLITLKFCYWTLLVCLQKTLPSTAVAFIKDFIGQFVFQVLKVVFIILSVFHYPFQACTQ